MTRKIYAIALALGMFSALSTPGHAALSGADRPAIATTQAPAQAVEANASQGFAADAPAAAKPATTAIQAAPVTELRKPIVQTAKTHITPARRIASRFGYPCH